MKNLIIGLSLLSSLSALADINAYIEVTTVGNCYTYVRYENVYKKQNSFQIKSYSKSMTGEGTKKFHNPGIYTIYNFGKEAECRISGNKVVLKLNEAEPTEVEIGAREIEVSIGIDIQDTYRFTN